jgi:uncharacterized protein with ATP-grasp and redox domains
MTENVIDYAIKAIDSRQTRALDKVLEAIAASALKQDDRQRLLRELKARGVI